MWKLNRCHHQSLKDFTYKSPPPPQRRQSFFCLLASQLSEHSSFYSITAYHGGRSKTDLLRAQSYQSFSLSSGVCQHRCTCFKDASFSSCQECHLIYALIHSLFFPLSKQSMIRNKQNATFASSASFTGMEALNLFLMMWVLTQAYTEKMLHIFKGAGVTAIWFLRDLNSKLF